MPFALTILLMGPLLGVKLWLKHCSRHLTSGAVTTAKIKNGTLTGDHVPLNSLPITDFSGVFSIANGGTGQTSFQNNGVCIQIQPINIKRIRVFYRFKMVKWGLGQCLKQAFNFWFNVPVTLLWGCS